MQARVSHLINGGPASKRVKRSTARPVIHVEFAAVLPNILIFLLNSDIRVELCD